MKPLLLAALCAPLVASLCGLAGCASPPTMRYYTLVPSAAAAPPAAAAPAAFVIDMLPVGVPEQLDQRNLVIRQGDGGLLVMENERWGGPLSDELRTALSVELTRRLATLDVAGLAAPPGRPVVRIKVQVRRFDAWPGDRARIDADWTLVSGDPAATRAVCHTELNEPTPGSHTDMVLGQQRLVARLAAQIGEAAERPDAGCGAATPPAAG